MQGLVTAYEANQMVQGDMTLGLWFGDHKGDWEPPVLTYAFNANFVSSGVVRLNAGDVDFPGQKLKPEKMRLQNCITIASLPSLVRRILSTDTQSFLAVLPCHQPFNLTADCRHFHLNIQ